MKVLRRLPGLQGHSEVRVDNRPRHTDMHPGRPAHPLTTAAFPL